jgi:hypothetical protein
LKTRPGKPMTVGPGGCARQLPGAGLPGLV